MSAILPLMGIIVGGLVLAIGFMTRNSWMIVVGFLLLPGVLVLGSIVPGIENKAEQPPSGSVDRTTLSTDETQSEPPESDSGNSTTSNL